MHHTFLNIILNKAFSCEFNEVIIYMDRVYEQKM